MCWALPWGYRWSPPRTGRQLVGSQPFLKRRGATGSLQGSRALVQHIKLTAPLSERPLVCPYKSSSGFERLLGLRHRSERHDKMGCCCSRSRQRKREGAATTSSELTSSVSSIPSSCLKPDAKLSSTSVQKSVQVDTAPVPAQNGSAQRLPDVPPEAVPPGPDDFLRCPSVVLFEDDTFFDAHEELQQEAPRQSTGLDVIFGRYENWMVRPLLSIFVNTEGCLKTPQRCPSLLPGTSATAKHKHDAWSHQLAVSMESSLQHC